MSEQVIKCPRCGGSGLIPYKFRTKPCPKCNGDGVVLVDTEKLVKI